MKCRISYDIVNDATGRRVNDVPNQIEFVDTESMQDVLLQLGEHLPKTFFGCRIVKVSVEAVNEPSG